MKLWRDLEIGENIKVGDRCCGYQYKWFVMDKFQIEMFRNLKGTLIVETSYPFQREVKQQDQCTITLSEDPERGDPNAG